MKNFSARIGLAVAAWAAVILSCYVIFVILNTFFLVPDNPSLTLPQNLKIRWEIIAVSAVVLTVLIKFARWAFKKRKAVRNSD